MPPFSSHSCSADVKASIVARPDASGLAQPAAGRPAAQPARPAEALARRTWPLLLAVLALAAFPWVGGKFAVDLDVGAGLGELDPAGERGGYAGQAEMLPNDGAAHVERVEKRIGAAEADHLKLVP